MHDIETVKKLNAEAEQQRQIKIEKVAQVLFRQDWPEKDYGAEVCWENESENIKATYREDAAAAIKAYEGES